MWVDAWIPGMGGRLAIQPGGLLTLKKFAPQGHSGTIPMSDKKKKYKSSELEAEIAARLELTEGHVDEMRTRWRKLPADDRKRPELLRQLEVSAAVCGELESLLSLNEH